jgi:hypothetical protein
MSKKAEIQNSTLNLKSVGCEIVNQLSLGEEVETYVRTYFCMYVCM